MKRIPENIIGGYFDEGVCINFVWRHPLGGTGGFTHQDPGFLDVLLPEEY
jgi:hypothetical protein